jgi:hypothetical protein
MGRIVKLKNFKGGEFYVKITKVPLGMLSRKEKDKSDVEEKNLNMAPKEAPCTERNLEELPGYIEVEVLFDSSKKLLDNSFQISIPVCNVHLISNKDEVVFEKILLKNESYQKHNLQNELNQLFAEFEVYNSYLTQPNALNDLMLEESKIILGKLQNSTPALLENIGKIVEDNSENINVIFILKIENQLHHKILKCSYSCNYTAYQSFIIQLQKIINLTYLYSYKFLWKYTNIQ